MTPILSSTQWLLILAAKVLAHGPTVEETSHSNNKIHRKSVPELLLHVSCAVLLFLSWFGLPALNGGSRGGDPNYHNLCLVAMSVTTDLEKYLNREPEIEQDISMSCYW